MALLIGSFTIGLILALLALGIFISFRIFNFPDITAEGSITFGASITAALIVAGMNPLPACLLAFIGGMLAGAITGVLHTRFKINGLLSGILVMTALYSINLHVMGKSNVPLISETTVFTWFESLSSTWFGAKHEINLLGWMVKTDDVVVALAMLLLIIIFGIVLFWFFKTDIGTSMRATGNNPQMIRALGVNTKLMIVLGLAISNGMIALSGALLAQFQGFADVQMGLGMLVWGLASVIIGEALITRKTLGYIISGAIMGSILFRLLVAIALRWGMNPNDLKLITAVFVFIALILPGILDKTRKTNLKTNIQS